jgi:hypothetical protein
MIGRRVILKRGSRDDGEKPFWISFADLMTALMVLFLVALSAALMNAQKETERAKQAEQAAKSAELALIEEKKKRDLNRERRTAETKVFLDEVQKIVGRHDGVVLDRDRLVINFGTRAQFASGKHELTLDQANALRRLVPELLASVRNEVGQGRNWLKLGNTFECIFQKGAKVLRSFMHTGFVEPIRRTVNAEVGPHQPVIQPPEWPPVARVSSHVSEQGASRLFVSDQNIAISRHMLTAAMAKQPKRPEIDIGFFATPEFRESREKSEAKLSRSRLLPNACKLLFQPCSHCFHGRWSGRCKPRQRLGVDPSK